jgi:hypothetical protein
MQKLKVKIHIAVILHGTRQSAKVKENRGAPEGKGGLFNLF